jgi:hypothetical protein
MLDRIPKLSAVKADQPQAMPLSELEYRNLLLAVHATFGEGTRKTRRIHALIRFQRYCGLSLCDVVALKRHDLLYDPSTETVNVITSRQKNQSACPRQDSAGGNGEGPVRNAIEPTSRLHLLEYRHREGSKRRASLAGRSLHGVSRLWRKDGFAPTRTLHSRCGA